MFFSMLLNIAKNTVYFNTINLLFLSQLLKLFCMECSGYVEPVQS